MKNKQVAVFSLNDELCGIESEEIYRIVGYFFENFVRTQNMPEYVDSFYNYRGCLVPIIDTNIKFGLGNTEKNKKTKVIIVNVNEELLGFLVNDVKELIKVNDNEIEETPEIMKNEFTKCVKYICKNNNRLISVLDFKNIIKDEELSKLYSFAS